MAKRPTPKFSPNCLSDLAAAEINFEDRSPNPLFRIMIAIGRDIGKLKLSNRQERLSRDISILASGVFL